MHRRADRATPRLSSLDSLEDIAVENGGIRQLLNEQWRKVYQANSSRGVFTHDEMHAASEGSVMRNHPVSRVRTLSARWHESRWEQPGRFGASMADGHLRGPVPTRG